MSKICPICGSIRIVKAPSGDVSICLACESLLNTIDGKSKQTLFNHITASPEVLAESVVYTYEMAIGGSMFRVYWTSPFVENFYPDKSEAIAVTVAKLKEVYNETTSN